MIAVLAFVVVASGLPAAATHPHAAVIRRAFGLAILMLAIRLVKSLDPPSMKITVIKCDLVSGALSSLMMLLTIPFHEQIGFGTSGLVVGYTTMILEFLLIYFGVRSLQIASLRKRVADDSPMSDASTARL